MEGLLALFDRKFNLIQAIEFLFMVNYEFSFKSYQDSISYIGMIKRELYAWTLAW